MVLPGIIGSISEYDPNADDWTVYAEKLEQYFAANSITDKKIKVATLLSLIGTATYKLLRDLTFPELPKDKEFEQLTTLLKQQFSPILSGWRERLKFWSAQQAQNEAVQEWYARVRSLAVNCAFGNELNFALKEKFLTGMKKGSVLDRLCEEDMDATLENILKLAVQKESKNHEEKTENHVHYNQFGNSASRGDDRRRTYGGDRFRQNRSDSAQGAGSSYGSNRGQGQGQRTYNKMATGNGNGNANGNGSNGKLICKVCGKKHPGKCKYSNYKCNQCNATGHLEVMCRTRRAKGQNLLTIQDHNEDRDQSEEEDSETYDIFKVESNHYNNIAENCFYLNVNIAGKNHKMYVDTGSCVTAINKQFFDKFFKQIQLKTDDILLKGYTGSIIKPMGYFVIKTTVQNKSKPVKYYVVDNGGPCLLGRDFLKLFNISLNVKNIKSVCNFKDFLLKKYKDVFTNKIGTYKYDTITIPINKNCKPIFMKHRPVPLAYRQKVEEQIAAMVKQGVLEPTTTSKWATPIVPVRKADGTVRICGDYKATINQCLDKNIHYPLPRINEIFEQLSKGTTFSTLDLNKAYTQLEIDEESQEAMTLTTHLGLFKPKRLLFGVSPAAAIFQMKIEQTLQGLPSVAVFADDICVTGEDEESHLKNLEAVLQRLKEAGLTVRPDKCRFLEDEIEYLGHVISKDGLKKSKKKVAAIENAGRPTTITQVRSFCGMVQYYSKFIPNLAQIMSPIYKLLKKENEKKNKSIVWDDQCEHSFSLIKKLISQDIILTHFNPRKPTILETDASDDGLSAVLLHREPDGNERPIGMASRTLAASEKNMAVIDREAAAIIFGLKYFQQLLIGHKFTIRCDHKPLLGLFGENKGIPVRSRDRLQRWALYMAGYDYKIEHIKGKNNLIADCLSRLPDKFNTLPPDVGETEPGNYINFASTINEWPLDSKKIVKHIKTDKNLSMILKFLQTSWPRNSQDLLEEMKPYFTKREELHEENGLILWGHRVVIPTALRKEALELLHTSHMGIVKTKQLARSYLWWPGLDNDIEKRVRSCIACLKSLPDPQNSMTPWPIAKRFFERVHLDYLQFKDKYHLVLTDAFSKWPEVVHVPNMTSKELLKQLRNIFSHFGLPELVCTDNGTPFVSAETEQFFSKNGIKHVTIPPYNSQSNGAAENTVKTFKNKLKAAIADEKNRNLSLDILIPRFLLNYRTTPHCTTKITPAELVFGRKLRTLLDLVKNPNNDTIEPGKAQKEAIKNMITSQEKQEAKTIGRRREFKVGEEVIVRDYRQINKKIWTEASIEKKIGKTVYLCRLKTAELWKRHSNQIRKKLTVEEKGNGNQDAILPVLDRKRALPSQDDTRIKILPSRIGRHASTPEELNQREIAAAGDDAQEPQVTEHHSQKYSYETIVCIDQSPAAPDIPNKLSNPAVELQNPTRKTAPMSGIPRRSPDTIRAKVVYSKGQKPEHEQLESPKSSLIKRSTRNKPPSKFKDYDLNID